MQVKLLALVVCVNEVKSTMTTALTEPFHYQMIVFALFIYIYWCLIFSLNCCPFVV